MRGALESLWADLRAKRLWPVAVVLLAGLVAVPVLLKKSPEPPPPAQPPAAQAQRPQEPEQLKGLATVRLEEGEIGDGSSLDTFIPADPFRPPERVVKRSEEDSTDAETSGEEVTLSEEITTPESGASPGGGEGGTDTGGNGDGSDTGDGGDTGDGDGGETTETREYSYVIDVTFSANGRTRRIKGMDRLDMLPNAASPLLLFLGVSTDAGNAVFLVDSTLEAAGEGRCEPNDGECAFVYLGAGSEHMFTNQDGDSYELRIDQIRKVRVDDGARASASGTRPGAGAALSRPGRRRSPVLPLISDLVTVSTTSARGSNDRGGRR